MWKKEEEEEEEERLLQAIDRSIVRYAQRFRESSVTKWPWFQYPDLRLIFHRSFIRINTIFVRFDFLRFRNKKFVSRSSQKSLPSHTHFHVRQLHVCRICLNILRSTETDLKANRKGGFLPWHFDVHTYPRLRAPKTTGSTQSLIGP